MSQLSLFVLGPPRVELDRRRPRHLLAAGSPAPEGAARRLRHHHQSALWPWPLQRPGAQPLQRCQSCLELYDRTDELAALVGDHGPVMVCHAQIDTDDTPAALLPHQVLGGLWCGLTLRTNDSMLSQACP